tara:strand:- start:179 stop:421 length:243 start_codon:yes stop_codon:yes gene_type:complete
MKAIIASKKVRSAFEQSKGKKEAAAPYPAASALCSTKKTGVLLDHLSCGKPVHQQLQVPKLLLKENWRWEVPMTSSHFRI